MPPSRMSSEALLLWTVAVPLLFAYFSTYLYCRVLVLGIAYAREESHRITPESPWFFFERVFGQMRGLLWFRTIGFVILASLITAHPYPRFICTLPMNTGNNAREWAGMAMLFSLGQAALTCSMMAGVTRCAPRLEDPFLSTMYGSIRAVIVAGLFMLSLLLMGDLAIGIFYPAYFCWGVWSFGSTWREIREDPTCKWFKRRLD